MQVRTDAKCGPSVASPGDTVKTFQVQTQDRMKHWAQQLQNNPDSFADIEQEIDQHYRQGGGKLVASLLNIVTEDPQLDDRVQQMRGHATLPLRGPQPRTLKVRILCGLVLWNTTAYCAP